MKMHTVCVDVTTRLHLEIAADYEHDAIEAAEDLAVSLVTFAEPGEYDFGVKREHTCLTSGGGGGPYSAAEILACGGDTHDIFDKVINA